MVFRGAKKGGSLISINDAEKERILSGGMRARGGTATWRRRGQYEGRWRDSRWCRLRRGEGLWWHFQAIIEGRCHLHQLLRRSTSKSK